MVTTAGNVDFGSTVGDAALDRLVVSCDGSRQETYEKYRRGGDFETVVRFMRDARRSSSRDTFIEWKYILFEFNDSDEDIIRAQNIADDIGVDSLLFIITNSKWNSMRFTLDGAPSIPLRSPIATLSPAAAMCASAIECKEFAPHSIEDKAFGHIDKCQISVGNFLTVEGWALDIDGRYARQLELTVDGEARATTHAKLPRADVAETHSVAEGARCGFYFRIPIDAKVMPASVTVKVNGEGAPSYLGGWTKWTVPQSSIKRRNDFPLAIDPSSRLHVPSRG